MIYIIAMYHIKGIIVLRPALGRNINFINVANTRTLKKDLVEHLFSIYAHI